MTDYLEALLEAQARDEAEPDGVLELPGADAQRPGRTEKAPAAPGGVETADRAQASGPEETEGAQETEDAQERDAAGRRAPGGAHATEDALSVPRQAEGAPAAGRGQAEALWAAEDAGKRTRTAAAGGESARTEAAAPAGEARGALLPADGIQAPDVGRAAEAAWLYRQVRRSAERVSAPTRAAEPAPAPAVEGDRAGGGLSARALDRLVERDARRYDGGFTLF